MLSTAPTNIPHPWKVEWARGEKFRCFLGRIYDPEVMATDEWEPERFPESLSQGVIVTKDSIQPKYLKKDGTSMNSQAYASSVKSGSVKVYTKAPFGRVTLATSVLVDEELGCAQWAEDVILAQNVASVYFVLHKTSERWMISAVLEADVKPSDIKLAVIKKRPSDNANASSKDWRLIQLWKSDFTLIDPPPKDFKVEVTGGAANGKLYCAKGYASGLTGAGDTTYLAGYLIEGFAVYPTASMTWGAYEEETQPYKQHWVANRGHVAIANAANGGCDSWMVCLISNFDFNTFGGGVPYLGVMATNSDAYTKTTPWGAFNGMPRTQFVRKLNVGSQTYGPDAVQAFEGSPAPLPSITVVTSVELADSYIGDHQCQRFTLANVSWSSVSSSWVVSQSHTGNVFWPKMFRDVIEVYQYEDSALGTPPPPPPTPDFDGNNVQWFSSYTGYTKDVSNPTTTQLN